MSAQEPTCPNCHTAEHIAGVVVRGVYDGILFWECMECGTKMHRWPEGTAYRQRAIKYISETFGVRAE